MIHQKELLECDVMNKVENDKENEELKQIQKVPTVAIILLFVLTWLLGAYPSFRHFVFNEAFTPKYRGMSFSIIALLMAIMFCEGMIRYAHSLKK